MVKLTGSAPMKPPGSYVGSVSSLSSKPFRKAVQLEDGLDLIVKLTGSAPMKPPGSYVGSVSSLSSKPFCKARSSFSFDRA